MKRSVVARCSPTVIMAAAAIGFVLQHDSLFAQVRKELETVAAVRAKKINAVIKYDSKGEITTLAITFSSIGTSADMVQCLKAFAHLPKLTDLEISHPSLTDDMLDGITGFVGVRNLRVSDSNLGDGAMALVRNSSMLERVIAEDCRISKAGLLCLPTAKLRGLYLSGGRLDDSAIDVLPRFEKLSTLAIDGKNITDEGIGRLNALKPLESLYLNGDRVSRDTVEFLERQLPTCRVIASFTGKSRQKR